MTQGFDEYLEINYNEKLDDLTKFLIHDAYKAGAASRQAEIDELQKRIKAIQKTAQRIIIAINDGEIAHARRSAIKIFKGESNE